MQAARLRRCSVYPTRLKGVESVFLTVCVTAWCAMATGMAWGGTIKGTVRFAGAVVEPKKLAVTIDQHVCGKEKDAEDIVLSPEKGIRNVVVSLQTPPPSAKWEAALPAVQIDQKKCTFLPRVVVVPVGGTVEFLNSDGLLHNVKSFSEANLPFNRAHPKGRTISLVVKKPEIIRVECDLHSWMRAWVVVADHPFYVVTQDQGEFVLDNVPPGRHTLQVWHESLGTVTKDATVGEKGVTTVTVEFSKR